MTEQEKEILEEEVNTEETVENTVEDAAEESAEAEAAEALDANVLQAQLDELNQRFLRTAADFENYKRRTALEKDDLLKYSNAKIIGEILPVLDNFQLALKTTSDNKEVQNVVKGVDMIYRKLLQVL
ncbi:MAG: nucleotide exchange factor GrpE, partial [Peptococcaceae bacterium]|nr:nucleotide exchange factor GrpE [Peptococcaceae bacterium]